MTTKAKARTLDACGIAACVIFPGAAAVAEFPYMQAKFSGIAPFLSALRISAAAFAVITVVAVLTAWRYLRHRLKMPKSGFFPSLVAFLLFYGLGKIADVMTVITGFCVIGCGIAAVLWYLADRVRASEQPGG